MVTESAIAILSRALLRAKFTRYATTAEYQAHARAVLDEIERDRHQTHIVNSCVERKR